MLLFSMWLGDVVGDDSIELFGKQIIIVGALAFLWEGEAVDFYIETREARMEV